MEILVKLLSSGIFNKEIILERNEFLKTEGTVDTRIYFISNGSVKISILQENGEQIIRFGYTGNLIVSLDSFISEEKSDFVIQAIKKTHIRVASKKDFLEFVYVSRKNTLFYIRTLEGLILQQMEREKDLLIDSPKERFDRVLKRNPELFQLIPGKHIANYLRMTPETFSRLKKS